MLPVGSPAPDFSALDQDGTVHTLAQYRGSWVMLYFYPEDDTPGCTTEACAIRDAWADFKQAGLIVLGVSANTVASHKKFAQKYHLPFTLLADPEKKILKAYGAWGKKTLFGRTYDGIIRSTYLIAPDGTVAKVYPRVHADQHAQEILADLKKLVS